MLLVYYLVLSLAIFAKGARILGMIPSPSYSHQHAFHPIWRELSLRGHQVTIVTTDPVNAPELTNLTQIDVKFAYKFMDNFYKMMQHFTIFNTASFLQATLNSISDGELSHPEVQQLKQIEKPFDLVLSESSFPEFLAFGELYKCPTALISSMELQSIIHLATGNPAHPVLYPEFVLPFYGKLSFKERIISTAYQILVNLLRVNKSFPEKQNIIAKHFGKSMPTVMDLLNKVDMLFVSVNPVLHDIRALGPTTIPFGGVHLKPPQPLPKDLKSYLDSATEGCIYFSLGTNVHSHLLTEEKIKVMLDTLKELPYKILWKYSSDDLPELPKNVKIIKWAPQQDVLRHPNIKLFITQGGQQSTEEAIVYHVPMLVMPFFGDQPYNAKRMEYKKVAKIIFHQDGLKKETLKSLILEVINNPMYKENTKKLAALAMDQPMSGLDKVVWWMEYLIRNGGAKHLRNPAADLPWYQYFLLDVAAVFVVFFIVVVVTLKIVCKLLLTACIFLVQILVKNLRTPIRSDKKKTS